MKRSKPLILVAVILWVVWTAWSAQGSDQVPQTRLPGETLFSKAFTPPLFGFGPGYSGVLPGGNAQLQAFLKDTMKETYQQALPTVNPPTSLWTYKKDSGSALLTRQSDFYGYFWDTSGRIKNSSDKNGFADLAYTFGSATPHLYLGHDNTRDTGEWRVGDDNATRMMYGVSIDYKVASALSLIPVFTFYDWGKQLNIPSKADINREWISGLQLRIVF